MLEGAVVRPVDGVPAQGARDRVALARPVGEGCPGKEDAARGAAHQARAPVAAVLVVAQDRLRALRGHGLQVVRLVADQDVVVQAHERLLHGRIAGQLVGDNGKVGVRVDPVRRLRHRVGLQPGDQGPAAERALPHDAHVGRHYQQAAEAPLPARPLGVPRVGRDDRLRGLAQAGLVADQRHLAPERVLHPGRLKGDQHLAIRHQQLGAIGRRPIGEAADVGPPHVRELRLGPRVGLVPEMQRGVGLVGEISALPRHGTRQGTGEAGLLGLLPQRRALGPQHEHPIRGVIAQGVVNHW